MCSSVRLNVVMSLFLTFASSVSVAADGWKDLNATSRDSKLRNGVKALDAINVNYDRSLSVAQPVSPIQSYPGGWSGWGYHSSTAAEGYARGAAEVIRSAGEANLSNSAAAINLEEAASMGLGNRLKGTDTYFETRRINKESREAEAGPRVSEAQAIQMAQDNAPRRLAYPQIDPVTGAIDWPFLLKDNKFAAEREQLDRLFAQRVRVGGGIGSALYTEVQAATKAMLDLLKKHVTEYSPTDYVVARSFIQSLAYEARFELS